MAKSTTRRMILYTTGDGVTLGITGDTWMDCLLALEEDFGEGMLPLYEAAKEEMGNVVEAVAETFAEELNVAARPVAVQVVEDQPLDLEDDDATEQRDTADEDDDPLDIFKGGDDEQGDSTPRGHPDPVAQKPRGGGTATCSVCAGETTKDYAELTTMLHGEALCPDCAP